MADDAAPGPAATGRVVCGLLCEEEEEDDGFCPAISTRPTKVPEPSAALVADEEDGEQAQPPAFLPPAPLKGHWHQLEGVPRPPASGPRFLAWNEHGHVSVFPELRRFEVRRKDEAAPTRVVDHSGLEMAAISPGLTCLAAGAGAAAQPRLVCRPVKRWDKAVFEAPLLPGEAPEAIACGDGFIAALTSQRLLRIYSASGMPLSISSVVGRGVALAARGALLLAVSGASPGGPPAEGEDDALEYRLFDTSRRALRATGLVPLSPGARLRWLGLTEEMAPVAIDTAGMVRALLGAGPGSWGPANGGAGEWVPVLSLGEEEAVRGPVWTLSARLGALICLELGEDGTEPLPQNGGLDSEGRELPSVTPEAFGHGGTQHSVELLWRLPLAPMSTTGALMEEVFQEKLLANHLDGMGIARSRADELHGSWRKKSVQLFNQHAKAREPECALDVARNLMLVDASSSNLLRTARVLADRLGFDKLAAEVARLLQTPVEKRVPALPRTTRAPQPAPTVPPRTVTATPLGDKTPSHKDGAVETSAHARLEANEVQQVSSQQSASPAPPAARPTRHGAADVATTGSPAVVAGGSNKGPPGPDATRGAAAAAAPTAPPPAATAGKPNPFATGRRVSVAEKPRHLLRDTVLGSGGMGAGARRMASPQVAASGEPPAKAAKFE